MFAARTAQRDNTDGRSGGPSAAQAQAYATAIDRVMATIEFTPSGQVITANKNFQQALGYSLTELSSMHHRQLCPPELVRSQEYQNFWRDLADGKFFSDEFRRITKDGRDIWIQATYNPIFDNAGKVVKVVKFATDITAAKMKSIDSNGQLEAINRSQAVIEFTTDGTIVQANENFCGAVGYALSEIKGRHHRMFVEGDYSRSAEYATFWERLRAGEYQAAEYKRIGKGGKEIWIQASYNPIRDPDGKVIKVVKYATDITAQVQRRLENARLAAVIERNLSEISNNVATVSNQSTGMAAAATEAASTLQGVASAAEELNASIREISGNVSNSRESANRAGSLAQNADGYAKALTDKAHQMTGIVQLINEIASQINLLALNATIESARAGEAGRGFAVVASEIKQLAAQVSNATKTISSEIDGVQSVSGEVVQALQAIGTSITEITNGIASVSAAIEQQSSATGEISQTMQAASGAVGEIDQGISTMATAMNVAASSVASVRANMTELTR